VLKDYFVGLFNMMIGKIIYVKDMGSSSGVRGGFGEEVYWHERLSLWRNVGPFYLTFFLG